MDTDFNTYFSSLPSEDAKRDAAVSAARMFRHYRFRIGMDSASATRALASSLGLDFASTGRLVGIGVGLIGRTRD